VTLLNPTIDAYDRNLKLLACWNRPGSTLASSNERWRRANVDSEVLNPLRWVDSIAGDAGDAGDRLLNYPMHKLMRLT
jgi:hypothetical protein